jgi:hypothetical protein
MYRFKTEEEFIKNNDWIIDSNIPDGGYPKLWNASGAMNEYLGKQIPTSYNKFIKNEQNIRIDNWTFFAKDYVLIEEPVTEELSTEELINKFKSLIT